jgi:hypothetical protein
MMKPVRESATYERGDEKAVFDGFAEFGRM